MSTKNEFMNFRIKPDVKQMLKQMAEADHRSMAAMLELLIREKAKQQN